MHRQSKAQMPTQSGAGQKLSIRAWEEERVATGHAASSSTDATAGSPAQKEPEAASHSKASLWRKPKHLQSCQGGGKGSYRAWISPASRGGGNLVGWQFWVRNCTLIILYSKIAGIRRKELLAWDFRGSGKFFGGGRNYWWEGAGWGGGEKLIGGWETD